MLDAVAQHALPNNLGCPAPGGRLWLVAYTHPQAEQWANSQLRRRGYQTFLPMLAVTRSDRVIPSLQHTVSVPAFPRYLFVAHSGQWTPIRYAPGIRDLVWERPGKPGTLTEAVRSAIQAACELAAARAPGRRCISPGDAVAPIAGVMAGHPAVVLAVNRNRAKIAVMLFGGLCTATLALDELRLRC